MTAVSVAGAMSLPVGDNIISILQDLKTRIEHGIDFCGSIERSQQSSVRPKELEIASVARRDDRLTISQAHRLPAMWPLFTFDSCLPKDVPGCIRFKNKCIGCNEERSSRRLAYKPDIIQLRK